MTVFFKRRNRQPLLSVAGLVAFCLGNVLSPATAEEMSGQAEQLQELMSFFKTGMTATTSNVASQVISRISRSSVHTTHHAPRKQATPKRQQEPAAYAQHEFVKFEE